MRNDRSPLRDGRRSATLAAYALLALATPCQPGVAASPVDRQPLDTTSGWRAAPLRLSLEDAVALGLRDNRAIRSARLARIAQKFDLVVANRHFVPRVDILTGGETRRDDGATATSTSVSPTMRWRSPTGATVAASWSRVADSRYGGDFETRSLTVSQPLMKGAGFTIAGAPVQQARLQEIINQLALKATFSDTITAIILAYRSLVQAQRQVDLADASLQRTVALVETSRLLIDAGRMAAADIVQAQSRQAIQRVALSQARQQQTSAQLTLLRLLALDLQTSVVVDTSQPTSHQSLDISELSAGALANRMDVLALEHALEQARLTLTVASNARLWDLSLYGSIQHQRTPDIAGPAGRASSQMVGLQLNIPFGDFSLRQSELRAQINVRTAALQLEELRQAVVAQVQDAAQSVEADWQQLELARQARTLTRQALDIAHDKLKAGRASNFEVLSIEADLRAADIQALTAEITYLNALTLLDQLTGRTVETWKIDFAGD